MRCVICCQNVNLNRGMFSRVVDVGHGPGVVFRETQTLHVSCASRHTDEWLTSQGWQRQEPWDESMIPAKKDAQP